jgi:hypothetical protein
MYAVGAVTLSSIEAVAGAGFGNATAMSTFLEAATGTAFTVGGYTAVSATVGGTSDGGGGAPTAGLQPTLIAGIVLGALFGVVIMSALTYTVVRKRGGKVAPWATGEQVQGDKGKSTRTRKGKNKTASLPPPAEGPPSPTDVDRIIEGCAR